MGSGSMSSREIDMLIFKKLTELFSVHQIDKLAKGTSDTMFLEKSSKTSDLISSITQDYYLDEQDTEGAAWCEASSTSVPAKAPPAHRPGRGAQPTLLSLPLRTPPPSGHEIMVGSGLSQDELIDSADPQETTADAIARRPCGAPGVVLT